MDVTFQPWDVTTAQIWLQVLVRRKKAERENPAGFPESEVMKRAFGKILNVKMARSVLRGEMPVSSNVSDSDIRGPRNGPSNLSDWL